MSKGFELPTKPMYSDMSVLRTPLTLPTAIAAAIQHGIAHAFGHPATSPAGNPMSPLTLSDGKTQVSFGGQVAQNGQFNTFEIQSHYGHVVVTRNSDGTYNAVGSGQMTRELRDPNWAAEYAAQVMKDPAFTGFIDQKFGAGSAMAENVKHGRDQVVAGLTKPEVVTVATAKPMSPSWFR